MLMYVCKFRNIANQCDTQKLVESFIFIYKILDGEACRTGNIGNADSVTARSDNNKWVNPVQRSFHRCGTQVRYRLGTTDVA